MALPSLIRQRIALVINSLDGGGAEKQLLLVARGLAAAGFQCAIFTLQSRPPHPRLQDCMQRARAVGAEIIEAPAAGGWRQFFRLRRWLAAGTRPVLWTWGYRADLMGIALRSSLTRVRQVGSLRDADEASIRRRRFFWRAFFPLLTACVSNSHRNVEQLAGVVPGAGRKCRVIYNGLEDAWLSVPPPRPADRPSILRITMLGNLLVHKKGYDLVVELAVRIQQVGLPVQIHIGGRPVEGAALRMLIADRGVEDCVKLEGVIADPRQFLLSGDVFLMLSRFEGIPNALLEAMALDLPAVCTRVGDVPVFARDGEHLRLVEVEAVDGVLAALQDFWNDWPAALALGRSGGRHCRALFSEERMVHESVDLFDALARSEAMGDTNA